MNALEVKNLTIAFEMYGKGIKYYMLFNFKAGRRMDVHLKADDQLKVKLGVKMRFF